MNTSHNARPGVDTLNGAAYCQEWTKDHMWHCERRAGHAGDHARRDKGGAWWGWVTGFIADKRGTVAPTMNTPEVKLLTLNAPLPEPKPRKARAPRKPKIEVEPEVKFDPVRAMADYAAAALARAQERRAAAAQ